MFLRIGRKHPEGLSFVARSKPDASVQVPQVVQRKDDLGQGSADAGQWIRQDTKSQRLAEIEMEG